jgi:hypothetical protein
VQICSIRCRREKRLGDDIIDSFTWIDFPLVVVSDYWASYQDANGDVRLAADSHVARRGEVFRRLIKNAEKTSGHFRE